MLYTALLHRLFGTIHGPISEAVEGDGLVLVVDGVGGFDLCALGMKYAAARSGLPHEVRTWSWGHGRWRWFADLTDTANHRRQAAALAAAIERFRDRRPESPVYLVGKSGGTGVAVWALEALPENTVESVVLLGSALSPGYDLSRALRAVRRELVSYHSPLDLIVLGIGTTLFGTIDRVRRPSAGLVGFWVTHPAHYAKLRQVRWRPDMARSGYWGGHVGLDHPTFLAHHVLPLLTARPQPASAP
jgi:pimeloyl-ACP methyl ester carboxylesterase